MPIFFFVAFTNPPKCFLIVPVCRAEDEMACASLVCQQAWYLSILILNGMIKGYSVCGPFEKTLLLFSLMKNHGMRADEYAVAPLIKMIERSVVSWNLLISCLEKNGRDHEAMELFRKMQVGGHKPDEATVVSLAFNGRCENGIDLFEEMVNTGVKPDDSEFRCGFNMFYPCEKERHGMKLRKGVDEVKEHHKAVGHSMIGQLHNVDLVMEFLGSTSAMKLGRKRTDNLEDLAEHDVLALKVQAESG
ncbi:hypothetical protein Ancab_000659 [Ancistrocladus abbreviatus]